MSTKRIEDIENHMIVEDLIYEGDGFVRESDFIFDDDGVHDLDNFDITGKYIQDINGTLILTTDTEEDMDLLEVLKYRGEKTVIDGEKDK